MKNHRFLWLRNRTTDNRKCEKARNIKEKRTIEMFSTVSRPPAALLSSASAKLYFLYRKSTQSPGIIAIPGLFLLIWFDAIWPNLYSFIWAKNGLYFSLFRSPQRDVIGS